MPYTNGLGSRRGLPIDGPRFRDAMRAQVDRFLRRKAAGETDLPNPAQLGASMVLEARDHVYGGTVGATEVAKRRAANKRARQARAMHRRVARR